MHLDVYPVKENVLIYFVFRELYNHTSDFCNMHYCWVVERERERDCTL